jgi:PAS domain-containing protein
VTPFGIILYDQDRRILGIDEDAARAFGRPSGDMIGRNLWDFVPRPDRAHLAEAVAAFERVGEASGRYVFDLDDGRQQQILYSAMANTPLPGLHMMAVASLDGDGPTESERVRRTAGVVYLGLELTKTERRQARRRLVAQVDRLP